MLMYPQEYGEFSQLLKRYVVLNIIIKVIQYDRKVIRESACKLSNAYDFIFERLQLNLEKDIMKIKKRFVEIGGKIIEEEQQPTVRVVKAKFRGFIYTHRFLNYLLQSESERLFKAYLLQEKEEIKTGIEKTRLMEELSTSSKSEFRL